MEIMLVRDKPISDWDESDSFILWHVKDDGQMVLLGEGRYGGEPEDNRRYRTYGWVEPMIKAVAQALGAKVLVVDNGPEIVVE